MRSAQITAPASETENRENGENVRIIATITLSAKHVRYYIDNEKYDKNKSQINEERMTPQPHQLK